MKNLTGSNISDKIMVGLVMAMLVSVYRPFPAMYMTILSLSLLLLCFLKMSAPTKAVAVTFYLPALLGTCFRIFQIPIISTVLCLVVFLFFTRKEILIICKDKKPFLYFFAVFLIFFLFFLAGPIHAYSWEKIINIFYRGIWGIFAMIILLKNPRIQPKYLSIFMLAIALTYISISFDVLFITRPMNLLDFDFLRDSLIRWQYMEDEQLSFTYHSIGVPVMLAVAFWIGRDDFKLINIGNILILSILIWVLLIAQARQAIVGSLFIILIRIILNGKNFMYKTTGLIIFALLMNLGMSSIKSKALDAAITAESSTSLVNREYDRAFEMIGDNFTFGTGLGGYSLSGLREYPHNIFLEILCECGVIGLLLLCFVMVHMFNKNHLVLSSVSKSGLMVLLPTIAFFVRANMSGDLMENIFVFCILIAWAASCRQEIPHTYREQIG